MNVNIEHYLEDGANWQAKLVMVYLQYRTQEVLDVVWDKEKRKSDATIYVGRYENCREQGYVFTLYYNGKQRHYAVYEHRNSDTLCVLISNVPSIFGNTPDVGIMWADKPENATKYDFDAGFACGDYEKCVDFIVENMKDALNEWKKSEPLLPG